MEFNGEVAVSIGDTAESDGGIFIGGRIESRFA